MTPIQQALKAIREAGDNPNLPYPSTWNPQHRLRKYQVVGTSHIISMNRFIIGDPTGSGKTPQMLAAWGLGRDKYIQKPPRLLTVTVKAAVYQWGQEITNFLPNTKVFVVPSTTPKGYSSSKADRMDVVRSWLISGPGSALVMNWSQFHNDWPELKSASSDWSDHTWLVLDEIQKIKNPNTALARITQEAINLVSRVYGLTATLVKNKAHDAWAIVNAVAPGTMSKDYFESQHCFYRWEKRPVYRRSLGKRIQTKVPILKEYRDLDKFVAKIAHLYLARSDDELESERPEVVHLTRHCTLSTTHRTIYDNAEMGLYLESALSQEDAAAAALVHAQLAANSPEAFLNKSENRPAWDHPDYLKVQASNSKLALLKELLEVELEDQPLIIYSRFATTIRNLARALSDYKPAVIIGEVSSEDREQERQRFMKGDTNTVLITDAGGEAINLQRAAHVIYYSLPWDPGTLIQTLGRARRFGSPHSHVIAWVLTAQDTVDELVNAVLTHKFGPFDEIVKSRGNIMPDSESLPLAVAKRLRQIRIRKKLQPR